MRCREEPEVSWARFPEKAGRVAGNAGPRQRQTSGEDGLPHITGGSGSSAQKSKLVSLLWTYSLQALCPLPFGEGERKVASFPLFFHTRSSSLASQWDG